jgi:hypothetical protein
MLSNMYHVRDPISRKITREFGGSIQLSIAGSIPVSAIGHHCNTDLTTISPPILRIYSCVGPKIERYRGKRPIGLWRWDMDCLIDVVSMALDDTTEYPSREISARVSLKNLHTRLKEEYVKAFD